MTPTDPIVHNVRAVAELERQAIHQRTRIQSFTDRITAFAGSPAFICGHAIVFAFWIGFNYRPGAIDPFPYSLLNVLVSLEAIFLSGFVLMTQNRMTQQADRRAHLDLQVNLLAEQELTAILQMLYALCQKAGTCARVNDTRVQTLLEETDIIQLAMALDKELRSEP